jgi:anti-sigma regulatory factor (Ser/Thr protein kinase)
MQADRDEAGPTANGASADGELGALRSRCWRQEQEIHSLRDTIAVFRRGSTALTEENADLRATIAALRGRMRDEHTAAGLEVSQVHLALDDRAPKAARTVTAKVLGDRVSRGLRERAELIASELTTNSVRHSGAGPDATLVLRIERSPAMLRLDVSDPGQDGEIAVRVPAGDSEDGFGLGIVQVLSERWGAERIAAGGTRVWAQLALATSIGFPPPV